MKLLCRGKQDGGDRNEAQLGKLRQVSMEWEMSAATVLDWKLVDVPELGYLTTNRPFPRGELLVKTRSLITGYYKHPKVAARSAARVHLCQHRLWRQSCGGCSVSV